MGNSGSEPTNVLDLLDNSVLSLFSSVPSNYLNILIKNAKLLILQAVPTKIFDLFRKSGKVTEGTDKSKIMFFLRFICYFCFFCNYTNLLSGTFL